MALPKKITAAILSTTIVFSSCIEESMINRANQNREKLTELTIPANFEWKTTSQIDVNVNTSATSENGLDYTVAIYDKSPNEGGNIISKGSAKAGSPFSAKLSLPQAAQQLYITQTTPSGITTGRYASVSNNATSIDFSQPVLNAAKTRSKLPVPQTFDVIVKNSDANLTVTIPWDINRAMTYYVPADVTYNGTLTFNNWKDYDLTLYVKGTMNISGSINIEKTNVVILEGGKLTINGNINTGNPRGETTIYVNNGAELTVTGTFNYSNSKTVENNGLMNIGTLDLNNNSKIVNNGTISTKTLLAITNNAILTNNGSVVAENNMELNSNSTLINNCHVNVVKTFTLSNNTSKLTMAQGSLLESNTFNTTGGGLITVEASSIIRSLHSYLYGSTFTGQRVGNSIIDFDEVTYCHPSVTFVNNIQFAYRTSNSDYTTSSINAAPRGSATIVHGVATASVEPCACNGVAPEVIADADGDGVTDSQDEYPNDANRAYTSYFPNKVDMGTYVIEDLWPSLGDYDVNDLILNFNIKYILNSANLVTAMEIQYKPKAVGAAFSSHAVAVSLDEILPSEVENVRGFKITKGSEIFALDVNGLEQQQKRAVYPVFDDYNSVFTITKQGSMINTIENGGRATGELLSITVDFKTGILPNRLLADININLFMILKTNGQRKEIHLPNFPPTDLAETSLFGTLDDNTSLEKSVYYRSKTLPSGGYLMWGMMFPIDFKYPFEQTSIMKPYLKFGDWVESGGTEYQDWYSNQSSDYLNTNYLYK